MLHQSRSSLYLLTKVIVLSVLLSPSLPEPTPSASSACPSACQCIWRSGKQAVLCASQGLIGIPNKIPVATQVLDLNYNALHILPSRVFQSQGLINLQKIFLSNCKLGEIAPDAMLQVSNLVELDLSHNLLTAVPSEALQRVPHLRKLLLSHNPLGTVKRDAFSRLSHLVTLDLSGSQVATVEDGAFRGLKGLQHLKLNENRLMTISEGVVRDLPLLYSFELENNPWHCDCHLRFVQEWVRLNSIPQSLPTTCQEPPRLGNKEWHLIDLDELACPPTFAVKSTSVTSQLGANITISCTVSGQPSPDVSWLIEDSQYQNVSINSIGGTRYEVISGNEGNLTHSLLTINNFRETDARSFICLARNRAGQASQNFTLSLLQQSVAGFSSTNSKFDLASAIFGLLLATVLLLIIFAALRLRSRRREVHDSTKPSVPPIDVLRNINDKNIHKSLSPNSESNKLHPMQGNDKLEISINNKAHNHNSIKAANTSADCLHPTNYNPRVNFVTTVPVLMQQGYSNSSYQDSNVGVDDYYSGVNTNFNTIGLEMPNGSYPNTFIDQRQMTSPFNAMSREWTQLDVQNLTVQPAIVRQPPTPDICADNVFNLCGTKV